jgi:hypothetical protein
LEVFEAAVAFASSGKGKDWKDVRDELLARGYKRAEELLDDDRIRALLDMVCGRSRKTASKPG